MASDVIRAWQDHLPVERVKELEGFYQGGGELRVEVDDVKGAHVNFRVTAQWRELDGSETVFIRKSVRNVHDTLTELLDEAASRRYLSLERWR